MLLTVLERPRRDRIAERREATRLEILDAAWELAQEQGLAEFTLRDLAERVGMRAPSLYAHFASKHAIYDAMFGQAWSEYEQVALAELANLPQAPRAAIRRLARAFFDFAVANPARHQLMNQRTIPGFEPSAESYAPAVRVLELGQQIFRSIGLVFAYLRFGIAYILAMGRDSGVILQRVRMTAGWAVLQDQLPGQR